MAAQRETFASWLTHQGSRPQSDPIGWLARAWDSFAGERPRLSSPVSIGAYLSEHGSQETAWQNGLAEAIEQATIAYREAGQPPAGEQQPSPPADGEQLEFPAGRLPEQHAADMAMADAAGEVMGLRTGDLDSPGLPGLAMMLADHLGRIEAQLGLVMQMLAVSSPAAAQVLLDQLGTEQQAVVDQPLGQLLDQGIQQNRAHEIAERNGWLAQPATMAGGFEQWWNAAEPAGGDGDG